MLGKRQMSETYLVASILAVAGGFLDAYSYICRGGVFANAQTGNIVMLGISAYDGKWVACVKYVIPIVMFVVGVFTAETIRKHLSRSNIHWRQYIIVIEAACLIVAGFMPNGFYDNVANTIIAFVCSLQVESFRKVNSINVATTMCTGNLRTASEHFYKYRQCGEVRYRNSALKLLGIIGFFIIGVVAGAGVTETVGCKAVFVAVFLLAVVFALMFIDAEKVEKG